MLESMNYKSLQITFQEVPDEISLCFLITGCPLRCRGCHSSDAWASDGGRVLTRDHFEELLEKYGDAITCVCFLGGEWEEENLRQLCRTAQRRNFKTCLYTGLEDVGEGVKEFLDFLKVGPYVPELGGLASRGTNQKFIDLKTMKILNHRFAQGGQHDQTRRDSAAE